MTEAVFEPTVVGAIGRYDQATLERMVEEGFEQRFAIPEHMSIWSDHPTEQWSTRRARGFYWGPLDPLVRPTSFEEVRSDACAAGVAIEERTIRLHADFWGASPLYVVWRGDVVYFSNRLTPTLRAASRLSLDPVSWLSLATLMYIPPGLSPVREVQTLRVGESIVHDRLSRTLTSVCDPPELETGERFTVNDVAVRIGDVMEAGRPSVILLSGGFDSRLLLVCGQDRGLEMTAFITDKDDGNIHEVDIATTVANKLAVPYELVTDDRPWDSWFLESMRRLDYSTTHHPWSVPLASRVRAGGHVSVNGVAGGVLLSDHNQDPGMDRGGHDTDNRVRLFDMIGGDRLRHDAGIDDQLVDRYRPYLEADFVETAGMFADQPGWQAMSAISGRIARSVAHFSSRLIGPRPRTVTPFLVPDVARVCLSPGVLAERGPERYSRLLATLSPAIKDIPSPSTADPAPAKSMKRAHPEAIRRMAEVVNTDPSALALAHERLRPLFASDDPADMRELSHWVAHRYMFHAAFMLAMFRREHPRISGFE